MEELKEKYERSIIKLGNSKAITFPQEWTSKAKLEEKSTVILYPIDNKTIIIRAFDKERQKTSLTLDGNSLSLQIVKQEIISTFKLSIDEVFLTYNEKTHAKLLKLLIDLSKEIIGMDFKEIVDKKQFYINFLVDTSKKSIADVLSDLVNVFDTIIRRVIDGTLKESVNLILAEIDKKYYLGVRILILGLSDYPITKGFRKMPIIRSLGDRVILLYVKDFINESLNLEYIKPEFIRKYSNLLTDIPNLLINVVKDYNDINFETISQFQDLLNRLQNDFHEIQANTNLSNEELQIRAIIKYFLNSFQNFFDIAITRLIEAEVGIKS